MVDRSKLTNPSSRISQQNPRQREKLHGSKRDVGYEVMAS